MAASHRRRRRAALRVVLALILVCAVGAGVVLGLLSYKLRRLQRGATFDFSYQITLTGQQPPALYTILAQAGAAQGRVSGLYAPGQFQLALALDSAPSTPITHIYIDANETLYDIGRLYRTGRSQLAGAYPLAGALLPDWTLGDYISQSQLAQVLGVELQTVALQDMTGFTLALTALRPAQPAQAREGYRYFTLPNAAPDGPRLTLGLPADSVLARVTPLHLLLEIPAHGVSVQLTGTLSPSEAPVLAPTSRMRDEDIAGFVQLRETVEEILAFVQNAAGQFIPQAS